MTVSEIIKGGGTCKFIKLRSGVAYYNVEFYTPENGNYVTYQFTIPLDDLGNGSLYDEEKPITLMRWIRKSLENNELILIKVSIPDLKENNNLILENTNN